MDPDDERDDVVERPADDEPDDTECEQVDRPRRTEQRRRCQRVDQPRRERERRPHRQCRGHDGVASEHRCGVVARLLQFAGEDDRDRQQPDGDEQSPDPREPERVDQPPGGERDDADRVADRLDALERVVEPVECGAREHRRELVERPDDGREDGTEHGERDVCAPESQVGDAERRRHREREVEREQEPERRNGEETAEREREVLLRHVERPRPEQRPGEVVREHPEPGDCEATEPVNPVNRPRRERGGHPGDADGHQRELEASEPPRVEFDAGPDGDELRHRTEDGETDPPREQEVDVCQPAQPGCGVDRDQQPGGRAREQEAEPDDEVPERDRHRWLAVRVDIARNRGHSGGSSPATLVSTPNMFPTGRGEPFCPRPATRRCMIVLNATIPVDPDSREQAVEAATDLAQASRAEDGVVDYRVTADLEDENVIRIFEQYEDDDAVNAHMESDHFLAFQGQVPEFAGGEVELYRFDVSETTQMM